MIALLVAACCGAFFVDIKAQVERLRKGHKPSLFHYGAIGNALFAIYYTVSGTFGLIVAIAGIESYPTALGLPGPILFLKTFYLGFAISTNMAFLSKAMKIDHTTADDTASNTVYLTNSQLFFRELHRFHYELSKKF